MGLVIAFIKFVALLVSRRVLNSCWNQGFTGIQVVGGFEKLSRARLAEWGCGVTLILQARH